jgi:hypothetical protein
MTYTQFKSKWLGKRVDYDHVNAYQCVDLIKQYAYELFGIKAGAWGAAVDYWYETPAALLAKFDRIKTTNCKQGDIVILKPIDDQPKHADGHIGLCDSQTSTAVRLLEQNGMGSGTGTGLNAIGVWRDIPKSRILGALRPKAPKPSLKMPAVGSHIQLIPKQTRTTFKNGTTTVAGHIKVTDNSFIYQVRGYDKKYPYRILINSKSGGGNGVALALYYTNGAIIDGWKRV